MYAKDISKKIKGVLREKELKGEYLGSITPYGYKKSTIYKNFNGDISIDISNLNTDLYIAVGIFNGGANDSISTNIYSVWLEK